MSRIIKALINKGISGGLDSVSNKIYKSLVESPEFRKTVTETEKMVIKGIRFVGNPEKETAAFHRSEKDTIEYLAEQARQAAKNPKPKTNNENASNYSSTSSYPPQSPPNVSSSGYHPESEWSRWYKTQKYELGVLKRKIFK